MPKVEFVKKAQKDYPSEGIKKGESYYWWKFNFGPLCKSKTPPKQSQLTRSDFLASVYDLQDRIGAMVADNAEDLKSEVDEIVDEIRQLGEEQSDKLSNMPDSLQESQTGELLQGRADSCEEWADNLEGVDLDIEKPEEVDEDDLDIEKPTLESIDAEDLAEGQTKEQKLDELEAEFEEAKVEKLDELQEEYSQTLRNALEEIQGYSYEGE